MKVVGCSQFFSMPDNRTSVRAVSVAQAFIVTSTFTSFWSLYVLLTACLLTCMHVFATVQYAFQGNFSLIQC